MVHLPKITGNSKYRVFPSSHFLILLNQEEMKLWKKQVKKSQSSTLYPCAFICLPLLCSLHPTPSLMLFCSPMLALHGLSPYTAVPWCAAFFLLH